MEIRIYIVFVTTLSWTGPGVESQFSVHNSSTNNCWQDKVLIYFDLNRVIVQLSRQLAMREEDLLFVY